MKLETLKITKKNNGFSLIELLVGITILLVLVGISVSVFGNLNTTQTLNSSVEQIITVIEEARVKTLSSNKSLQHGVRFESDKIILFEGNLFVEEDPNNQEFLFSDNIEIYSILLNGDGPDVVFQKLTGETDQFGTISIRSQKKQSVSKDITIKSTGVVEI